MYPRIFPASAGRVVQHSRPAWPRASRTAVSGFYHFGEGNAQRQRRFAAPGGSGPASAPRQRIRGHLAELRAEAALDRDGACDNGPGHGTHQRSRTR
jgi:hypothetical protein